MNKNIRWKVIAILAVLVVFAGVGVYPIVASYFGVPAPQWIKDRQLKLGLDLKGGVHLVLRVRTDTALRVETELQMQRIADAARTAGISLGATTTTTPTQFKIEGVPNAQDAAFRQAAATADAEFDR